MTYEPFGSAGGPVLLGALAGGRMGGQPSVFDSSAGEPSWSPYWDHMTYLWKEGADARVLTNESEVHDARDARRARRVPENARHAGEIFPVKCPVPVVAPNTFTG